jgi:hypothetical protein
LRRDIVGLLLTHYAQPHTKLLTVPYSGANGERYQLSGSTLKIRYRGAELTILQFNNEDARIKLTEDRDKPDPDTAERNRDPLVIDFDGDQQVALNNGRRSVYFDMNSDGFAELSAWVRPTDALLGKQQNRVCVVDKNKRQVTIIVTCAGRLFEAA